MSVFAKSTAGKSDLNPHNKGNERESFFGVQAKLNIGKSNDKYEAEADRVADTVVANKKNIDPDPFFTAPPAIQNKLGGEKIQKIKIIASRKNSCRRNNSSRSAKTKSSP